jgi:MFS superfamily sulfate permease-like transporter
MHPASIAGLVLAYAVGLVASLLAISGFFVGKPVAGAVAIAAGVVALWLIRRGEAALDAQALQEFEGQFMD